jgi:monoamine oxidase
MSCLLSSSIYAELTGPKGVVIGGGLTGLTLTHRLKQGGVDVELYEGQGRVGGRVFIVNVTGNPAELGGQNISDGKGKATNFLRLAQEFGLEIQKFQLFMHHSFYNGKKILPISCAMMSDLYRFKDQLQRLEKRCRNMKEVLAQVFQ